MPARRDRRPPASVAWGGAVSPAASESARRPNRGAKPPGASRAVAWFPRTVGEAGDPIARMSAAATVRKTTRGLMSKLNRCALAGILLLTAAAAFGDTMQWSKEKANDWYARQRWLIGSDYIPSDAINQLEMWQAATFNPAQIDK